MNVSAVRTLFDYNYWAHERIFTALEQISAQQFTAPNALVWGSIRGTLVHALSAEWIWRQRCQYGLAPDALLDETAFPTQAALRQRWNEEEAGMRAWLDALSDEDLLRTVEYRSTTGKSYQNVLWNILLHVVNHGTQHRSEAAQTLTELGHSPGDLDMIIYFRLLASKL
jgi:uncharacterized damage-inducible protein DinB